MYIRLNTRITYMSILHKTKNQRAVILSKLYNNFGIDLNMPNFLNIKDKQIYVNYISKNKKNQAVNCEMSNLEAMSLQPTFKQKQLGPAGFGKLLRSKAVGCFQVSSRSKIPVHNPSSGVVVAPNTATTVCKLDQRTSICGRQRLEYCKLSSQEMAIVRPLILGHLVNNEHSRKSGPLPTKSFQIRDKITTRIYAYFSKSVKGLRPQTLFLAVRLSDLFLTLSPDLLQKLGDDSMRKSEVVALTCLWVAAKCEQYKVQRINDFLKLANEFNLLSSDLVETEQELLEVLDFDVLRHTPYSFLELLITHFPVTEQCYQLSNYLLELTLLDAKYLAFKDSVLALACIYLAIEMLAQGLWNHRLAVILQVEFGQLKMCLAQLLKTLDKSSKQEAHPVVSKYGRSRHCQVARIKPTKPPSLNLTKKNQALQI